MESFSNMDILDMMLGCVSDSMSNADINGGYAVDSCCELTFQEFEGSIDNKGKILVLHR